jgi:hypothetical protein
VPRGGAQTEHYLYVIHMPTAIHWRVRRGDPPICPTPLGEYQLLNPAIVDASGVLRVAGGAPDVPLVFVPAEDEVVFSSRAVALIQSTGQQEPVAPVDGWALLHRWFMRTGRSSRAIVSRGLWITRRMHA